MQTIIIVGEKFAAFARAGQVQCISAVQALFEQPDVQLGNVEFVLGQGVSPARVSALLRLAETRGLRKNLRFDQIEKCGQRHVHKQQPQNSVVSVPKRLGEDLFSSELSLEDDCELLSDHVAGKHLQGMVLIEAARQMCLAVTEEFFSAAYSSGTAFLWTSISVRFLGYAFPSHLHLVYRVLEHTQKQAKSDSFVVEIEFVQGKNAVAACNLTFETRDKVAVERRETKLALAAASATADP